MDCPKKQSQLSKLPLKCSKTKWPNSSKPALGGKKRSTPKSVAFCGSQPPTCAASRRRRAAKVAKRPSSLRSEEMGGVKIGAWHELQPTNEAKKEKKQNILTQLLGLWVNQDYESPKRGNLVFRCFQPLKKSQGENEKVAEPQQTPSWCLTGGGGSILTRELAERGCSSAGFRLARSSNHFPVPLLTPSSCPKGRLRTPPPFLGGGFSLWPTKETSKTRLNHTLGPLGTGKTLDCCGGEILTCSKARLVSQPKFRRVGRKSQSSGQSGKWSLASGLGICLAPAALNDMRKGFPTRHVELSFHPTLEVSEGFITHSTNSLSGKKDTNHVRFRLFSVTRSMF